MGEGSGTGASRLRTSGGVLHDAGFEVLGVEHDPVDVVSVWRAFTAGHAVPCARVPDREADASDDRLDDGPDDGPDGGVHALWEAVAAEHGVLSPSGELLVAVGATSDGGSSWHRVRATSRSDVWWLRGDGGGPDFVASSLDRSVRIGVLTEEWADGVFVTWTDPETGRTPVPTGGSRDELWARDRAVEGESRELLRRAGVTLLGEVGTRNDVDAAWNAQLLRRPTPRARVPVAAGAAGVRALQDAWWSCVVEHGVVSDRGELLLAVATARGRSPRWWRAAVDSRLDVSGLGAVWGEPAVVATDLAQTVSVGIVTPLDHRDERHVVVLGRLSGARWLPVSPTAAGPSPDR